MPISNSAYLHSLIKSMTKADKRNFRLYAKRVQSDDEMLFLQLFDVIDKMDEVDDERVLTKMPDIDKGQLSNLKRHLYKQILTSLRMININRIKSIEIREHIDYAHILYSKSLYKQSLKIMQRAKRMAIDANLELEVLQIIEFCKMIESRHITHTGPDRNDAQTVEASDHLARATASIELSNLRVRLHGYYIRNSHVRNEAEKQQAVEYFNANLPDVDPDHLGPMEQIYLYQSHVWHHYILLDFETCYDYAKRWVDVFEQDAELKSRDRDLYMRGFHYMMICAFNLRDRNRLRQHYDALQHYRKSHYHKFNENSKIFSFMHVHWARFNLHFLNGTYEEAVADIPRTLARLKRWQGRIAPHREMIYYYKIAWTYLGAGQAGKAVTYLNRIINQRANKLREDVQTYSRLLFLMAHYDLHNLDILPYLVKTVDTFFKKKKAPNRLQISTLAFFRKLSKASEDKHHQLFEDFRNEISLLRQDEYERRAFLYLDIPIWLDAHVEGRSISEVTRSQIE